MKSHQVMLGKIDNPVLRNIIGTMTAFDPNERYADCTEVIDALNRGLGMSEEFETGTTREAYVLGAGFIGRRSELTQLTERLEKSEGGARALWVQGNAGVGKSRLFYEFKKHCQVNGYLFFEGSCSEHIRTQFGPLLPVLSMVLLGVGDDVILLHGAQLKRILPEHPRLKTVSPAPAGDPQTDHVLLTRSIVEALIGFTATCMQKCVLYLNDMQWSDDGTVEALDLLLMKKSAANQAVCSLYAYMSSRTEGIEPLTRMKSYTHLDILRLQPFDETGVRHYIEAVFGAPNIGPLLRRSVAEINRKVGGNPFFLQELIRSLIAGDSIVRGKFWELTRGLEQANIPRNLSDMVQSRLTRLNLPQNRRDALAAIALLNRGVSRQELCGIYDTETSFLQDLERLEIVKTYTDTGTLLYRMNHDLIRETVVEHIENREALHSHIARSLERMHERDLESFIEELAYQYFHGHEREKARQYLRMAAERATQTAQNGKAVSFYTMLLSILDESDAAGKIGINVLIIECLWGMGDLKRMNAMAKELLPVAEPLEDKKLLARLYFWLGASQSELVEKTAIDPVVIQAFGQAITLSETTGDKELISDVLNILAYHYFNHGKEYEKALELFDQGFRIAKEIGNDRLMAFHLCNRAQVLYYQGKFEQAIEHINRAMPLYKEHQKRDRSLNEGRLGINYAMTADFSIALQHIDKGIVLAEEIGNNSMYTSALIAKIQAFLAMKEFGKAKTVCDLLEKCLNDIFDPEDLFTARLLIAKTAFAKEKRESSMALLVEMLEKSTAILEKAQLNFELWLMTKNTAYRDAALPLCRSICDKTSNYFFKRYLANLETDKCEDIDTALPSTKETGNSGNKRSFGHFFHTFL